MQSCGETWARPTSESITAHDPTSQIVAQLSENSSLVTGKNKRVGVSSARLNPATRDGRRRRSARGPLLFSSSNSMRERVPYKPLQLSFHFQGGTKLPTHLVPYNPHGPLEIFHKLQYGPRAHLRFQQSPTRSRGPIVSSVPITVSIYQCFSEDLLGLSFT